MSTQKIKGFIKLLLTMVSVCEPSIAAVSAMQHIHNNNFHCSETFLAYWKQAMAVPLKEGIFVVPSKVATGYCGSVTKTAGVCTSPPPPTIESMKPAAKAAIHRMTSSILIDYCI